MSFLKKDMNLRLVFMIMVLVIGFAYDGYCEAKSLKEEALGRIKKFPTSKK